MVQIEKRDKSLASFNPNKILSRIKKAAKGLKVNSDQIFINVMTSLPVDGVISTKELDTLVSGIAAQYTSSHYDYSKLAAGVAISSWHKTTKNFYDTMLYLHEDGVVHPELIAKIQNYGIDKVNALCKDDNDYNFDYFAWKSLENVYLLKDKTEKPVERPQHMYLRVALWLTDTFEEAKEFYTDLSNQLPSCATPIMLNAGTVKSQLASCVLHYNDGDSREELLDTIRDISLYSSAAAGIGLCLSNQRSKESRISTSSGHAGGVLKYVKIVNECLRFFNQNGKRPGSAAIYLEPWHRDIEDLLEIRLPTGKEEQRARDVFTALWIPDNFMRAVENDTEYYLFCPNDIKKAGLKPFQEIYGEEFEAEYQKAIDLDLGKKVKAMDLWIKILKSQIESGTPYLLYKDEINRKSNHKNIGTVKQSNLCAEIVQYTDEETTAICTLASIVLKNFINNGKFDFDLLYQETRKITRRLNKVIDINLYATEKGLKGGMEQRAIAIGTQGLADTFYLLDYSFSSQEAKDLNKKIYETIYFASITESNELVKAGKHKKYKFFDGSPFSEGKFQFNMWGMEDSDLSGLWDWGTLRASVMEHGLCNSMFTAAMPTASSAKITGSYEMFEPMDSNLFNRRVLGGEFVIVNKYLISDLEKIGMWSESIKNEIILGDGSIQNVQFQNYLDPEDKKYEQKVQRIEHLLKKYRTIWEHSQRELIDLAADRAPFIDQTQSMNVYFAGATVSKLTSSHIYAWKKGLKTGCYYVRTKAVSTGAKHLAIDQKIEQPKYGVPEEPVFKERPANSMFECTGCDA